MKRFKFWIASIVLMSLFFGACKQVEGGVVVHQLNREVVVHRKEKSLMLQ
ncbi:MAG: hypothetical protein P1P64_04925 [Treponemataceae bacterium]